MPKVQILTIKNIKLASSSFKHVLPPEAGFKVILTLDKKQILVMDDKKVGKALEEVAKNAYKKFLIQTLKRLQKFDKLFAGMLGKGAAEADIAKQALALKNALEKETPKWEKAVSIEVMAAFKKLATKKR